MRQVLQNARSGEIEVADVPSPKLLPGSVLVRIAASLVSPGTERASSQFARKNLFQKAKARPDLVRDVIGKLRRDGLVSTFGAVQSRLDQPTALGYSSAGTVVAVAPDVQDVRVGDRVACAGAGYAVHAELACVPRLLVAKIPTESPIGFDEAAFTTVGTVALHGLRTGEVQLGDVVAVIGLGLLGQLTVQLLKAAGARVIGLDLQQERATLAAQLGAEGATVSPNRFRALCAQFSCSRGVDSVLITAETPSSDPVNLAAEVLRDRGVVVAVGTVGMDLQRKLYYEKELDFRISRSYGPGRYDAIYEQKGRDYPVGYVRWTETRNMEAFLHLIADRRVDVRPVITHRFPVEEAQRAYEHISGRSTSSALGVLITYSGEARHDSQLNVVRSNRKSSSGQVCIGLLGAGNFACSTLIPAIKSERGTELVSICASSGSHSAMAGKKFGFRSCTTDEAEILCNPNINTVVIATRHHSHAGQVAAALKAGKHVFCEKPLCLNDDELSDLVSLHQDLDSPGLVMVGFNRRFAPMTVRLRKFVSDISQPMTMHYRVNAGTLPADHWINDSEQGGGRIIGEVCHFIDLLAFLAGSQPVEVETRPIGNTAQSFVITLRFANGSDGTITYLVDGDRSFSKERIEVFGGGCAAVIEDFRRLEMVSHGRRAILRSRFRQDKGHRAEWRAFARAIQKGEESPIPFHQIVTSTLATFRAEDSRCLGKPLVIDTTSLRPRSVLPVPSLETSVLKLEPC